MRKKVLSGVLAAVLLVSAIIGNVSIVQASSVENNDIKSIVEKQVEKYLDENYSGVDSSDGLEQILTHAIYGDGKDLILDQGDDFTAVIMNSKMNRENVMKATAALIEKMLETHIEKGFSRGGGELVFEQTIL